MKADEQPPEKKLKVMSPIHHPIDDSTSASSSGLQSNMTDNMIPGCVNKAPDVAPDPGFYWQFNHYNKYWYQKELDPLLQSPGRITFDEMM